MLRIGVDHTKHLSPLTLEYFFGDAQGKDNERPKATRVLSFTLKLLVSLELGWIALPVALMGSFENQQHHHATANNESPIIQADPKRLNYYRLLPPFRNDAMRVPQHVQETQQTSVTRAVGEKRSQKIIIKNKSATTSENKSKTNAQHLDTHSP